MRRPVAFLDANVLYSAPTRDLLMHLALLGVFRPRWTDRVHEEWISTLLRNRPDLTRDRLEKTRRLMDAHAGDSLVEGYESLIPTLDLPDPADRHVLAAAIRGGADGIVTLNRQDFPDRSLAPFGIASWKPDDFICSLFDTTPVLVVEAARRQRANLHRSRPDAAAFLDTLERNGLVSLVGRLRAWSGQL